MALKKDNLFSVWGPENYKLDYTWKYKDIKSSSFMNQCIRTVITMPYTQANNLQYPFITLS